MLDPGTINKGIPMPTPPQKTVIKIFGLCNTLAGYLSYTLYTYVFCCCKNSPQKMSLWRLKNYWSVNCSHCTNSHYLCVCISVTLLCMYLFHRSGVCLFCSSQVHAECHHGAFLLLLWDWFLCGLWLVGYCVSQSNWLDVFPQRLW